MTNYPFTDIEQFDDVSVKNEYRIVQEAGGDVDSLLEKLRMDSRDNSRTPMQWDANEHAGFTTGTP
ncbi:hypothetical protein JVW24_26395, partial [Vibrio cholerae O1]|nr:hypothetical protein [Vibrio cholerae O1]